MTLNEVAAKLQHYNDWRRGHHDEQPDPRVISEAIDAAVEMIDRLKKIESAAQNLVKMKGRHNAEIAYQRLVAALEESK